MGTTSAAPQGDGPFSLKNVSAIVGLLSTCLTVFIATMSYQTNRTLAQVQLRNQEMAARLSTLAVANTTYESATRLAVDFGVFNAREFAANFRAEQLRIDFLDRDMRQQLESDIENWSGGRRLMARGATEQVLLQQVVWLRLTNLSKTAATNLRLVIRQRDFDPTIGETGVAFDQLPTSGPGWTQKEVRIADLVEGGHEERDMLPQVLIPLAHLAGGSRYYGRVIVPVEVVWRDERMNRDAKFAVDLGKESRLRNALGSAMLGHMAQRGAPECITDR